MQDPRLSSRSYPSHGESLDQGFDRAPRSRAMRRRVVVFSAVFLLCALLSLAYTFMRPALYQAAARVQVTPQARPASSDAAAQQDNLQAFLVEMQVFSSRPLLEKVAERLKARGRELGTPAGADPVPQLQQMLTVDPMVGTNVALIEAHGPERLLVADLVNTVIDVYREEQARSGEATSRSQLADARDEAKLLDARVAERRKVVEAFRLRADIVSAERDENQVLARLKGLGTSMAASNDREAAAEGKLRAIEQAAADGRLAQLSKDNPTLASMEQRLSQWREEWRALERQFTPAYLGMDPDAKALKMRIDSLEQQIEVERGKSQQNAVAIAREELAGARAASKRLQQQSTEDRQAVQSFSRNFGEFKTMQDELEGLEKLRQAAQQRLMTLEASENTRKPRVQVLELATTPDSAWRPLYARDAAISVAASLLLAFLAVWFVEFFNRVEAQPAAPSTVVVPQPWMPYADPRLAGTAAPMLARGRDAADVPLLAQPLPRELDATEAEVLLASASAEVQPLLACLLCGLRPTEIAALRAQDVDLAAQKLTVPGDSPRVLALPAALLEALKADKTAEIRLFLGADGMGIGPEDIEAAVTSSAHDAHLARPHEVTAETLRHTYIAHLVRQGLRFGELGRVVGRLSPEALNSLAGLAPAAPRVSLDAVDPLLPGVQHWAAGSADSDARTKAALGT